MTAGISRLAERIRPKATARYTRIACERLQRLGIKSIRYNALLTDCFMIEQSRSHCKTPAYKDRDFCELVDNRAERRNDATQLTIKHISPNERITVDIN